jgi:alkylated DNA repair dioxygenase AlkB
MTTIYVLNRQFDIYDIGKECQLIYCKDAFLTSEDAASVRKSLEALPFKPIYVKMHGQTHEMGAQSLWLNNEGKSYKFTGSTTEAHPIPSAMSCIFQLMNDLANASPSHFSGIRYDQSKGGIWANKYQSTKGLGAHSDSKDGTVKGSDILSLSFGEPRVFFIQSDSHYYEIPLGDNTMCVMAGRMFQSTLKHGIRPSKEYKNVRYNLTFRHYIK